MKEKKTNMENEIVYINNLISQIKEETIKFRLENILKWYVIKSKQHKFFYYLFTIISLITASIIPIITTIYPMECNQVVVSLLSIAASMSISICNIFSLKENWTRYRRCAELLKSESVYYINKKGVYSHAKDANELFIDRIEKLTTGENIEWHSITSSNTRTNNQNKI